LHTTHELFAQARQVLHASLRYLELFLQLLLLREQFLKPERSGRAGFIERAFCDAPQLRLTLFPGLGHAGDRFTKMIAGVHRRRQSLVAGFQTAPRFLRIARGRRAGG
jgi:hypothetical protein